MKFNEEIGLELTKKIERHISGIPRGKGWSKYGKNRIYFNAVEEKTDIDMTFYVDFTKDKVTIKDFEEEFWLERIEPLDKETLRKKIEDLYYEVAYPVDTKFPAHTIREMKQHRRFEAYILSETDDELTINLLPVDLEIIVPKDAFEEIIETPREDIQKKIYRFVIKSKQLDEIIDEFSRVEDEADKLFMEQMQKSIPQKISITQDPEEKRSSEIYIDEGEKRKCIYCHKEFTSYRGDTPTEFCSNDCRREYQQEAW